MVPPVRSLQVMIQLLFRCAAAGKPTPAKATPAAATRSAYKKAQVKETDIPVAQQLFKDIMPEDDKVLEGSGDTCPGFV